MEKLSKSLISIPCVVSAAATAAGVAAQVGTAASGAGTISAVAALGGVAANVFAGFLCDHWGTKASTPEEIAANGQVRAAVAEAIRGTIIARTKADAALSLSQRTRLLALADASAKLWPVVETETMAVVSRMAPHEIPVRITDYYQRQTTEIATVTDWREFLVGADPTAEEAVLQLGAVALHTGLIGYLTAYLSTSEGKATEACRKLTFRLVTRLMEFAENADAHLVAIREDQRALLDQFRAEAGPVIDAMEKHTALVRQDIRELGGRVDSMLGLVAVGELRHGSRRAKKEAERFVREVRGIASNVVAAKADLSRYAALVERQGEAASTVERQRATQAKMLLLALSSEGQATRRRIREHSGAILLLTFVVVIAGGALWWKIQHEGKMAVGAETKTAREVATLVGVVSNIQRDLTVQKRELSDLSDDEYNGELSRRTGWDRQRIDALLAAARQSQDKSIKADALLVERKTAETHRLSIEAGEEKVAATRPLLVEAARDFWRAGLAKYFDGDYRQSVADFARALATLDFAGGRASNVALWTQIRVDEADSYRDLGVRCGPVEGNRFLAQAVTAYRSALEVYTRKELPQDWASTQNQLGAALVEQASRAQREDSARLYAEAFVAYRSALEVYTRNELPQDWAMTQNNLGIALRHQAKRTKDEDSARLCSEAIIAFRSALEVFTRSEMPQMWATVQNNLANALYDQTRYALSEDASKLYAESVSAFRSALEVFTRSESPENWAAIQNNLGNILEDQASRAQGDDSARLFAEAITAYRCALEIYTRDDLPQRWALTQNNLGIALQAQAGRAQGEDASQLYKEAISAYRNALEVRTREELPQDWAMTQTNLGGALLDQAKIAAGEDSGRLCSEAVTAYRGALEVYTRNDMPHSWAGAHVGLGNALAFQAGRVKGEDATKFFTEAVAAYRNALKVYTPKESPQDWAMTQNNLGTAFGEQASRTQGEESGHLYAAAVAAFRSILEVHTRNDMPRQWALTQNNLGKVLGEQAYNTQGEESQRLYLEAIAALKSALEVFTREKLPQDWAMTQYNLGNILYYIGREMDDTTAQELLTTALVCLEGAKSIYTGIKSALAQGVEFTEFRVVCDLARCRKDWGLAAQGFARLRKGDPNDRHYYAQLAYVYHEGIHDHAQAFSVHQDWLKTNPNDQSAQRNFTETHFTTERFAECTSRAREHQRTLTSSGHDPSTHAAMRVLEIASLAAQDEDRAATDAVSAFRAELGSRPADFRVPWTWSGTRHFIKHSAHVGIAKHRAWLLALIDAMAAENRDEILINLDALKKRAKKA